jgi:hypothetical protein
MNTPFYSVLIRVCLTTLAITLAFYGGLVVYLGQKGLEYRQEVIQGLQSTDATVKSLSDFTKPVSAGSEWVIPMERKGNTQNIMYPESWSSSPTEILNLVAKNVVTNCTEAYEEDQQVIDWLESRNVTHFLAHYNLAIFSLNKLVYALYQEFPSPPGNYTFWEVEFFVRSDFPDCKEAFLSWAQRYDAYYDGVSQIHSQIGSALQNISEAYIDRAKLASQELEQAKKENITDSWYIDTLQEDIPYYTGLSVYYSTIFEKLGDIQTQADVTAKMIHKHDQFFNLAFYNLFYPVFFMAFTGVVIPMALLGLGKNLDKWHPWGKNARRALTAACIIVFVLSMVVVLNVLWQQISVLYLP